MVVMTVTLLLLPMLVNAHADTLESTPTLFWKLKTFGEDIQEMFTFDPDRKKQLITEHALERQNEINECVKNGIVCPREFEIRRLQKIESAEKITTNDPNYLKDAITHIKNIGEYNEIRIAVSEFHQARGTNDPVQKELLLDQINDRINRLDTVQNGCVGEIDSRQIINEDNYYEAVQKICPKLDSVPVERAMSLLYGT